MGKKTAICLLNNFCDIKNYIIIVTFSCWISLLRFYSTVSTYFISIFVLSIRLLCVITEKPYFAICTLKYITKTLFYYSYIFFSQSIFYFLESMFTHTIFEYAKVNKTVRLNIPSSEHFELYHYIYTFTSVQNTGNKGIVHIAFYLFILYG